MSDTKGNWPAFWGAFWAVWSKSNLKIMCGIAESLRKVALLSFRRKVCSSVAEAVERYLRGFLEASETRAGTYSVLSQCCEKTAPVGKLGNIAGLCQKDQLFSALSQKAGLPGHGQAFFGQLPAYGLLHCRLIAQERKGSGLGRKVYFCYIHYTRQRRSGLMHVRLFSGRITALRFL